VPPHDPSALAGAMVKLLKDGALRARMGEDGLERVKTQFSVETMVDSTLKAYERVAR
jgi:glycosyltransferase involved in cell wall biosynthesis